MKKLSVKKTLVAAAACLAMVASVFTTKSYAAETANGKINITATATNKNKEVQKGIEFSLYQVAEDGTSGAYGYTLPKTVTDAGITAADFAGTKEVSEIAKTLDSAYAKNSVKAYATVTTDDNGKAEFTGLKNGIYLIRQTTSDSAFKTLGHTYTTDAFLVQITNVNKEVTCQPKGVVKDIPSSGGTTSVGAIAIIKVDEETNAYLAGAKFTLYKSSGEKVTSVTTDSKGWADVRYLEYGDYYLVEDEAPEGYVKRTDKITFTLNQERSYSPDYPWNIKVTNTKATVVENKDNTTKTGGIIKTGDYSNAAVLCIVGGISLIAACGLMSRKRKQR